MQPASTGWHWCATHASLPSFSINGTNAAKNTTATFYQPGNYTFNVVITDSGGLSVSTNLTVVVTATINGTGMTDTATWTLN